MKRAVYNLGIFVAVSGFFLIYGSLAMAYLDSYGYWGYPKDFFQALLQDRVLGVQGLQLFHFLVGGLLVAALGGSLIVGSTAGGVGAILLEPWTYSYKLLGGRIQRLLPHFEELHGNMKKGGVKVSFPAYLSFMILTSISALIAAMVVMLFLWPILLSTSFFSVENFVLSLMFAGLASVVTLIMIYAYPGMKSSNRRIPIEVNLPYISSFLTLLSSSNVPPRKIFRSLARIDTLREVRQEFSSIVRDVEVFGQDLLTSILENATYTPSGKLKEILNGYVATIRTGGNPTDYLRITTQNIMKEKMVKLDLMLESLSAVAEIYIMVLVAMPLLFVVMFATLGMLGGSGGMNPVLMLYLLLYVGIPVLATILIVVVSTFTVW